MEVSARDKEAVDKIKEFLDKRKEQGLFRTLSPVLYCREGRLFAHKKEYLNFSSNDYLGLANHPKLKEAAKTAIDRWGSSSSASRLMSGDLELHHRLEEKVAQFKNKEAALVFNSGYQANVGTISALCAKGDCIFFDRLAHASIIDGITLSGARFFRFQHNDTQHLQWLLEKERPRFSNALLITESIFSMDGDRAPLKDLVSLKERYNCQLLVDEAHASGIFGKNGSGVVEEEGLTDRIDFIMGTFSKALGSFGAYFAASGEVIAYLINTARSFIYSTALPPSVIACNLASIDLIREEPERRHKLLASAKYFRQVLKENGLRVRGDSQIVPLIIGKNQEAMQFAQRLQERGYWVLAVRPPTVPHKEARLRFSLTVEHDRKVLDRLIEDIRGITI